MIEDAVTSMSPSVGAMIGYLAVSRPDAAQYIDTLFFVYSMLILVRILLTWIPRIPYNTVLNTAIGFVNDVTDPYLNLFRRLLPPARVGGAAIDFSPVIALFVLFIAQSIVVRLIAG